MNTMYLEGTLSCKAMIETHPASARILYVDEKKRTRDFSWIIRRAREAGIAVVPCARQKLDELTDSRSHGGMVLETEPLLIPDLDQTAVPAGFVCFVEGVEDPHNLGSVCRTLYAAGCGLLILPRRSWDAVQPVIMRASAGCFARLPLAAVDRPEQLVQVLQQLNRPILCAERKDARPLFGYDWPASFCLCIGGALRGLSRSVTDAAAQNLFIPYRSDMKAALDTPSAAAVFAFAYAGEMYETENK
ncbi:RNA methyltransferase [uncultured Faecalibaculum sp.]|uniref:TrmH family RNA methyltransferase n=1 Tax=uncultured Faecalibaculum sp. TaxID=1729681 RepID=UPI0025D5854D|nr:TrmH family RNA methyltransferase [uncultured Faecalibaculum sp.]